jgi:hypothetical protein
MYTAGEANKPSAITCSVDYLFELAVGGEALQAGAAKENQNG